MIDLTTVPVPALLELHVDLLTELRRREVVRSAQRDFSLSTAHACSR